MNMKERINKYLKLGAGLIPALFLFVGVVDSN